MFANLSPDFRIRNKHKETCPNRHAVTAIAATRYSPQKKLKKLISPAELYRGACAQEGNRI